MRISTSHFLVCAALACSIGWAVSVPDTEAQARAREAVRQKIRELHGQVAAPIPGPVAFAQPANDADIARARAAMLEKMEQLAARPPAEKPSAEVAKAEAARARQAAASAKAEAEAARVAARAEAAKARRETARAKAEAAEAKGQPEGRSEAEKQALRKAEAKQLSAPGDSTPMVSPSSLPPGSKEARLAELLKLYKADTITPAEYHTKRAAIIAGS